MLQFMASVNGASDNLGNEYTHKNKHKGWVAITDKICPLEKIHFFYVKRSRRVSESKF